MQLCVGRVNRGHGVGGQVLVDVRTDDPDARFAVGTSLLTDPPERGPLVVATAHRHSGRLVVGFDGLTDRTAADGLRGTVLLVESADLPATGNEDEFGDYQLIGLAARTVGGAPLGQIADILHGAGNDLLVLQREGEQLLVPFVRAIVPTVDLAAGVVLVDPPDGLLDLPGS